MLSRVAPILLLMSACGAAAPATTRGGAAVLPISGWPPAPVRVSDASEALRRLVRATEELPPLGPPAPEAARTWAERVYAPWMSARANVLETAAVARRVLREQPRRERVVGAGLHGAILERTAAQLAEVDLRHLDDAAIDEVRAFVPALRRAATQAFEVCHEMGLREGASMDAWRAECDRRLDALARRRPAETEPSEEPPLRD